MEEKQLKASLIKYFQQVKIEAAALAVDKMVEFYQLLQAENKLYNLTAITTVEEAAIRHFVDSLLLTKSAEFNNAPTVLDVGSGAGFPGIPLAILFPDKQFVLLDALQKRVGFLHKVIAELDLKNVQSVHERAESFAVKPKFREQFAVATARAVAGLAVLCEYCLPAVKLGGHFIAMKSLAIDPELAGAVQAIDLLGGGELRQIKYELPDGRGRQLVIIEKIRPTPPKYPRRPGIPQKKPL